MAMTCPKCHGDMRTYERSGITVDQCTECRGIFLDRGELERLVDAETSFHAPAYGSAPAAPAAPAAAPGAERFAEGDPYRGESYRDDYRDGRERRDLLDKAERYLGDRYRKSGDRDDDDYYRSSGRKKKKRSFLEDLFD